VKDDRRFIPPREGFTLIEVLVAIALISFGCFAAGTMQIAALKAKNVADNVIVASFLAESELERLKTLSMNELTRLNDYEDKNLSRLGEPSPSPRREGASFDRSVRVFQGEPTAMSYSVEIEITWRDSTGPHYVLHSAVLTGTSYF
jgi:prepilin-type N-terminal cleavage/methylation domain-containing protein